MCFEKQQRIRKELKRFYVDKLNFYRKTKNEFEADRLASQDIFTKIKEEKE